MNTYRGKTTVLASVIGALLTVSPVAFGFESGSTGADGAFNPTVNTQLQLPPSGIFNFTSVTIPVGVTVTFKKNATNTPVIILASENVSIAGAIGVSGGNATAAGAAGDGNLGDDGIPGKGGPGGYDGGVGGMVPRGRGGDGLGPGGGTGGRPSCVNNGNYYGSAGGGGFGGTGGNSTWCQGSTNLGGASYGSKLLLPLVGGSGGGGGAAGNLLGGSGGGGGGGGAILIAASGTVSITGGIYANGGWGGNTSGDQVGSPGGGGSGGGIRIVASTITGNGPIQAVAGGALSSGYGYAAGGEAGGNGRIRLEAETFTRTAASSPTHEFGPPGPVFIAGLPTLRIASVAGVAAPAEPTGNADITLPSTTTNPVTVVFQTTGVPVGNTVKLTVKPATGAATSAISPALVGTTDSATASVDINLAGGPSILEATTAYTIVAAVGDALGAQYAKGERVEKIELAAIVGGPSTATLITVSGKRYPMVAPIAALGG